MKNNMRGGTARLLGFELKKLLTAVNIIVFLALMLVKPLMMLWYYPPEYDFNLNFYREYTETLYGEHTPEKSQYILDERARLNDIISKEREMADAFTDGELTAEEYNRYNTEFVRASNRYPAFEKVSEHCEYFDSLSESGKTPWWFYDLTLSEFLAGFGADPLFLVFIIVFGLRFFGADELYGMSLSVGATPYGRQKRSALGIAALVIFCTVGCVVSMGFDMLSLVMRCGGEYFNMPICSMEIFADCGYDVTVLQYLLLILLVRIVWSAALCVILLTVKRLVKNTYASLAVSAAVIFIPLAAANALPDWLKTMLAGSQLTGFSAAETSLDVSVIAAMVTIAVFFVISASLRRKS